MADYFLAHNLGLRPKKEIEPLEGPEEQGARSLPTTITLLWRDTGTKRLGDRELWRMLART